MNIEVKDLGEKLIALTGSLKKYLVFIFIMIVLSVYGYLVFYINVLATTEPDEDLVTERLKTVQRPRIDENALNKIKQLEDQNVQVQTLFQEARDNPFVE